MIERPRLRRDLTCVPVEPDEVFLLGEDRSGVVLGEAAGLVAPLLDGTRTTTEIAMELGSRLSLAAVLQAVRSFERGGFLADGPPPPHAEVWDALGVDPAEAEARIAAGSVEVVTVGGAPAD